LCFYAHPDFVYLGNAGDNRECPRRVHLPEPLGAKTVNKQNCVPPTFCRGQREPTVTTRFWDPYGGCPRPMTKMSSPDLETPGQLKGFPWEANDHRKAKVFKCCLVFSPPSFGFQTPAYVKNCRFPYKNAVPVSPLFGIGSTVLFLPFWERTEENRFIPPPGFLGKFSVPPNTAPPHQKSPTSRPVEPPPKNNRLLWAQKQEKEKPRHRHKQPGHGFTLWFCNPSTCETTKRSVVFYFGPRPQPARRSHPFFVKPGTSGRHPRGRDLPTVCPNAPPNQKNFFLWFCKVGVTHHHKSHGGSKKSQQKRRGGKPPWVFSSPAWGKKGGFPPQNTMGHFEKRGKIPFTPDF